MLSVNTKNAEGFSVKFANGNTLSVKWGDFHMCENKWTEKRHEDVDKWTSRDCEVYATNEQGEAHWFTDFKTEGHVSPERLAEIMMFVSTNELDTVGERFKFEDD